MAGGGRHPAAQVNSRGGQGTHLQKHEEELPRCEHFLVHQTVRVVLHALSFGQSEELPGHETEHVKLFSIGFQVDTDALAVKTERSLRRFSCHDWTPTNQFMFIQSPRSFSEHHFYFTGSSSSRTECDPTVWGCAGQHGSDTPPELLTFLLQLTPEQHRGWGTDPCTVDTFNF